MVEQPLGVFYLAAIPAKVLLQTCFSDRLRAELKSDHTGYMLQGTQRELQTKRLKEIADYINTEEVSFPNSIILAANFRSDNGLTEEDSNLRWRVEKDGSSTVVDLVIPTQAPLCAIIDGQHRLFAFTFSEIERLDTPLVCAIFIDLPRPYQAFLFATINSTQKSVDRSQTYELFGYNVEDEKPERWSPDKMAVFLARKLNSESTPLKGRIIIAAENEFALSRAEARREGKWMVSMATVVDGIVTLVSRNPKSDGYKLLGNLSIGRSALVDKGDDAPLRSLYLASNDLLIYSAVLNFLTACQRCFWEKASPNSYITKTIGIQALFDILKLIAKSALSQKTFNVAFYEAYLERAKGVDFSNEFFANPSGSGRSELRRFLIACIGLPEADGISKEDKARYELLYPSRSGSEIG
jgi:DNA phosphorothioation-associated DGQHR protein 1